MTIQDKAAQFISKCGGGRKVKIMVNNDLDVPDEHHLTDGAVGMWKKNGMSWKWHIYFEHKANRGTRKIYKEVYGGGK